MADVTPLGADPTPAPPNQGSAMLRKIGIALILCAGLGFGAFWFLSAPDVMTVADLPDHQVLDMDVFESVETDFPFLHISHPMLDRMLSDDCKSHGWPIDGHFNAKGYTLMGNILFDAIQERYPSFLTVTEALDK